MNAENDQPNQNALPESSCSALLACPWCDSEKVMAEGTDKRMAMVCQKCLARGPEVNVTEGRDVAIREWNKALRRPHEKTRYECERCGMTVALIYYGTNGKYRWKHIGGKRKQKPCGLPPKVRQANDSSSATPK